MTALDPLSNSEVDLDAHPDWEQNLIDIAYYRQQAAKNLIPYDPEWDAWEMEALIALGRVS